jgi:hypothetical protein
VPRSLRYEPPFMETLRVNTKRGSPVGTTALSRCGAAAGSVVARFGRAGSSQLAGRRRHKSQRYKGKEFAVWSCGLGGGGLV